LGVRVSPSALDKTGSDLRCYTDEALANAGPSVVFEPMYHRCIKTFARDALGITRFPVESSSESCFVARFEKAGEAMGWKATGQPTVRQQRDKWVVRVDGIDTETGARRPRQIGTYPSKRAANSATSSAAASGEITTNKERSLG
jgi:hypothetical protein